MKVAIFTPASAGGARLIESFHLSSTPAPVALAAAATELSRAGRFPIALRVVDPTSPDSFASAFAGCSAAVLAPTEHDESATLTATAAAFVKGARHAHLRRVVFISDVAVHGSKPLGGTHHNSPLPSHAAGTRAATFAAAEAAFLAGGGSSHPTACVLRAGRIYGARAEAFARLVTELTAGATDGDTDDAAFNGLHVDNLVAAVRAALSARLSDCHVFPVVDTGRISMRDWRKAVATELVRGSMLQPSTHASYHPTSGKARTMASAEMLPGYRPVVDVAQAIRLSCAWWRFVER